MYVPPSLVRLEKGKQGEWLPALKAGLAIGGFPENSGNLLGMRGIGATPDLSCLPRISLPSGFGGQVAGMASMVAPARRCSSRINTRWSCDDWTRRRSRSRKVWRKSRWDARWGKIRTLDQRHKPAIRGQRAFDGNGPSLPRSPRAINCSNLFHSQCGITTATSPHLVFPRPLLAIVLFVSFHIPTRVIVSCGGFLRDSPNIHERMRNASRCLELG
jgi:hypothetical protein